MMSPEVQGLLSAVRRRLWRVQLVAAARLALWGSAGLMLLAVVLHLSARQVPAGAVLMVITALWVLMLAWTGTRRPADAACALWADRHLGGASAFTTLLETALGAQAARHPQATQNPQAVQWLESWATARVPEGLRRLAEHRDAAPLSRPLLAVLVCAALTAAVLSLPTFAPTLQQQTAASSPSGRGDPQTPQTPQAPQAPQTPQTPAQADADTAKGVDRLAAALRAASLQQPAEPSQALRETGQAQAAAPDKVDGATPAAQAAARPTGEPAPRSPPPAGTTAGAAGPTAALPAATPPAPGTGNSAGAGTGNEAGDSRDARGDRAVSPAPRGTMPQARPMPQPGSAQRQADGGSLGSYEGDASTPGAASMPALAAAAAATPPAAHDATRLSPAETSYVQAWMKANAQRR